MEPSLSQKQYAKQSIEMYPWDSLDDPKNIEKKVQDITEDVIYHASLSDPRFKPENFPRDRRVCSNVMYSYIY